MGVEVCSEANESGLWSELIPFLMMCRKTLQENLLDTELIYSYARTNNLVDMEKFVNGPNVANIQMIGDRCFSEGIYNAAKILFSNINNNSKLALCHINLEEFREAVAAAQRANNVSTWKQVCFSCLRADEYRLAAICGLEVIKYPKHVPDKVMEHCKVFFNKLNVSKVVKACERARLYSPAVYLYMTDKQFDSAVKIMMERAPAFTNELFLDSIVKVRNSEILYKAVGFYITMHPTRFTRLMEVVDPLVDHSRVVNQLRRTGDFSLKIGKDYMKNVQKNNASAI